MAEPLRWIFTISIILTCCCIKAKAQEYTNIDKRHVSFFIPDPRFSPSHNSIKQIKGNSDAAIIGKIALFVNKDDGTTDTLKCRYKKDILYFNRIDSSKQKIFDVILSVELKFKKRKLKYDERMEVSIDFILKQTDERSNVIIQFKRKENNVYDVIMSKLDFPFIHSSEETTTEVIGFSPSN